MKCVLPVCVAALALVSGCASVVETSAVPTTSASMSAPVVSTSKAPRVATVRTETSLRTTAAMKSRCESGDDSACLVAASFER